MSSRTLRSEAILIVVDVEEVMLGRNELKDRDAKPVKEQEILSRGHDVLLRWDMKVERVKMME